MRDYLFVLLGMVIGAVPLTAIEFDATLIDHLPPSVAEWHSREGNEFCESAEAAGMSWATAHSKFTGEKLSAKLERPGCLIIYSGDERAGRIYLMKRTQRSMLLRIVADPEYGSFQSSRIYRFRLDFAGLGVSSEQAVL